MWDNVFYGNTIRDWLISIVIIVGAILLDKLLQILNKKVFKKIASKTNTKFDDILLDSLETPILWGIMLIAIWVAILRLHIPENVTDFLVKAYKILAVLNITWFFARLFSALLDQTAKNSKKDASTKRQLDKKFLPLVRRMLLIFIWAVGLIMALNNVGISVASLLATLGIGGVALALASQDTIKNILGGITIFIDQPFQIGDTIRYDTTEGNVEDIGLRSTRIRTYEKRLVTVPNYKIMDAAIVNISKEPRRRVLIKLGLTYDTTPEKMKEAIQILKNIPERVKEVDSKDLVANFTDFGDSALLITFIYFIKKSADIGGTTSNVNFEILSAFNKSGLNFAFPSQTIYLEKDEEEPDATGRALTPKDKA